MTTEGSTVAATQTSMTNNDNQMTTLGPVTPEQEAVKSQVSVIFLTTFLCILVHGSAIYRVSQYKVSESKSYHRVCYKGFYDVRWYNIMSKRNGKL